MQFEIKPQSNTPIYQQLRDQIILGIATGELAVGELLPSVRQLAEALPSPKKNIINNSCSCK